MVLPPTLSSQLCTASRMRPLSRFVVMRRQPVLVLGELRVRHLGEDFAQRIARDVGFLDAHDGGFADFEHRHSPV